MLNKHLKLFLKKQVCVFTLILVKSQAEVLLTVSCGLFYICEHSLKQVADNVLVIRRQYLFQPLRWLVNRKLDHTCPV